MWELEVDQGSEKFSLDEAMEGARAWWPEPTKGSGEVLVVQAERSCISLVGCTSAPPGKDGVVKVYPKPFLEGLRDIWQHPSLGLRAARQLGLVRRPKRVQALSLPGDAFDMGNARRSQREAGALLDYRVGFLWGPPGTGKTTTVGMMIASVLAFRPDARVLLLSTTNAAVDQALESVDKSLERLGRGHAAAATVRTTGCHRFGRRFLAEIYKTRPHLLPTLDRGLLNRLIEHESRRPPADDTPGLATWNQHRDELRAEIQLNRRAVLLSSRLVAMTTTGATFSHEPLSDAGPFDWVVFDEGSQVSQAHFGALAMLGQQVVVAGDPQQLGPVVLSDSSSVQRWLSRTPFDLRDAASFDGMVFLEEQSRMAGPICDLVGNAFYQGRLRLASDAETDRLWRAHRQVHDTPTLEARRLNLIRIADDGHWHAGWRGPIRGGSADAIVGICRELCAARCDDILILTPFRAQRALLKSRIESAALKGIEVWTVHRAQGSEHHTVVFDPVMGFSPFLCTPEARRLINVALSRAKARLVITLSPSDERNPMLRDVARLMRGEPLPRMRGYIAIEEVLQGLSRLDELVGRKVLVGDFEGEVVALRGSYVILKTTEATVAEFNLETLPTAAGRR